MRFPLFTSVWQRNRFGDLLILLKNSTLSRSELNYNNGQIKNIHYGDILIKFNDFILSDSKLIPFINNENIPNNYSKLLLKNGDIIIADTAEDNTVGKATEIIFNDESLIISGLHTIPCRPIKNTFASKYLGYYLNSPSFHNQLLPLIQGIKVSSIAKSQIVDTQIAYPDIKEQQKISNFLSLIDQRIITQSKIIEDLEYQINAIRGTIFSSLQCRWIKLCDLIQSKTLQLNRGNIIPKHQKNDIYKYPVYSSSTQKDGLMGYSDYYMFDQELITWSIDGGGNVFYRGKHKFCVTNVCGILKIDTNKYSYRFVAEVLKFQHSKLIFDYQAKAHPSVIEKLYSLPNIDIKIQNKYSNLFKSLYKKLEIEQKYLEKLKEQKKYLLSNMFI